MLKFDYNKAKAQVQELRAIADDMEQNKTLASAIEKVNGSWEGEVSKNFLQKCSLLTDLIKKEIINIRAVANSLETSAKAIADAEKKAEEALTTNTVRSS
jgi:uncharacterized protein YukE